MNLLTESYAVHFDINGPSNLTELFTMAWQEIIGRRARKLI